MNRKATLFTLEEVLKLVLGAMILIFTIAFVWNLADKVLSDKKTTPTEKSFDALVEEMKDLKDGQMKEIPVFTDDGTNAFIMLGFEKDKDTVSGTCNGPSIPMQVRLPSGDQVKKPVNFCGDSGCFCLYEIDNIHFDYEYHLKDTPVKCVPIEESLKGGTFELHKERLNVWSRFAKWMDAIFGSSDIVTVSCGPAIIPPVGGVALVQIVRDGDTISVCWGDKCEENVLCSSFSDAQCADNKDKCYPNYKSWDFTYGKRTVEYDGCFPCTKDFRCSMISTKCKGSECKEACARGHCGVSSCTWANNECQ
jgi:hypothetical protein